MNLSHTVLAGQTIQLEARSMHSLGPALRLEDCTVDSSSDAKGLILGGLQMTGGKFLQRKRLSNVHFTRSHFHGVQFEGTFSGCDFGAWDDADAASISHCDFSAARLDGCRFLAAPMETIGLPRWPCFTVIDPFNAVGHVQSRTWPGKLGIALFTHVDWDPTCVAVCGDAERMAQRNGLSLDQMRVELAGIPGLHVRD